MLDVLTIGSATRDIFARSEGLKEVKGKEFAAGRGACFPLGSKLDLEEVEFFAGGGAINTAVTFANQGLRVAAVAAVGEDPEAAYIRNESEAHGISTKFFQTDKRHRTSFSLLLSVQSGRRTAFRSKGASWHLSAIPPLNAAWLYVNHMAGDSDKLLPRLLREAKKRKLQIAWNPGTTQLENRKRLLPLLKFADVFIVNQEEAALITGVPYEKRRQIFRKLDELVQGLVIMTRGPKGVEVSDGTQLWSAGVLPLKRIVERTGAGDAFGSGFVASLIRSPGDVERAIQFASANATGVLTKWGAHEGLLKKGESPSAWGKLKIRTTAL